ncbi:MAG: hypothetical protein ISS31_02295 [Kiritimatiellae bacterium]|nr:hypothetical protein [Kiritimatiellia bacterium]
MNEIENNYQTLLKRDSIADLETEAGLRHLGLLIDTANALRREAGLKKAVSLGAEIEARSLSADEVCRLNYFLANAWSGLRGIKTRPSSGFPTWEDPEAEQEILHYRTSLSYPELDDSRVLCPALTNLANVMSWLGRPVEAIAYWDRALARDQSFGMARGNRGYGIFLYGQYAQSETHRHVLWRQAYRDICQGLDGNVEEHARGVFERAQQSLEKVLSPQCRNQPAATGSWGEECSAQERKYRMWALENCLFLTPTNEVSRGPDSANDDLMLPDMVVGIDDDMRLLGMMNQLKQEYASARYIFYTGLTSCGPHFSDRLVRLVNTLDYPSYSLAAEQEKAGFRIAYSVLDKIAFFLNEYLDLGIRHSGVSFRSLWYQASQRKKGLRPAITCRRNLPLHGLFWLSKDLFEDAPGFRDVIAPEARGVSQLRNHLEHRYLKLHEREWIGAENATRFGPSWNHDALAYSVYRHEFEAKALWLLKTVRAALIYLTGAVFVEEALKERERTEQDIVPPIPLDYWEDDWKR